MSNPLVESCIDAIIVDEHRNVEFPHCVSRADASDSIYRAIRDGRMEGEEFREFINELVEAARLWDR